MAPDAPPGRRRWWQSLTRGGRGEAEGAPAPAASPAPTRGGRGEAYAAQLPAPSPAPTRPRPPSPPLADASRTPSDATLDARESRSDGARSREAFPSLDSVLPPAATAGRTPGKVPAAPAPAAPSASTPPTPAPSGKPPLPAGVKPAPRSPPRGLRLTGMAAFAAARSSFDVDDGSESSDDGEGGGGGGGGACAADTESTPRPSSPPRAPPPPAATAGGRRSSVDAADAPSGRLSADRSARFSAESARSAGSSGIASAVSARSSFSMERRPDGDASRLVEWPPPRAPVGPPPALPGPAGPRAAALALVPPDTPLPTPFMRLLWRLETDAEAEVAADELAAAGVMKVARLADGSAWGLALAAPHAALVEASAGGSVADHTALVLAYAGLEEGDGESPPSPPSATTLAASLAALPDDGYWLHNAGHHLAGAARLDALAALVADAGWLDAKLRSYGAAAVTADFRRAMVAPPGPGTDAVRLLLAAFQMAAPAAAAAPTAVGVLQAAMQARLLAARVRLRPTSVSAPEAAPGPATSSCGRGLAARTPSLEQVGGVARLTLRGHTAPVVRAIVAPNGVDVVTCAADGAVRVFDLEVGDAILTLPPVGGGLADARLDATGRLLLTAGADGVARVFDLAGGACVRELGARTPRAPLHAAALDAAGRTALTAGADGRVRAYDVEAGRCLWSAAGHGGAGVRCAVLGAPDGRLLGLTGGEDFNAVAWDVRAGRAAAVLAGHSGWVVDVALAPAGRRAATASADGTARIWCSRTGSCERVLAGHGGRLSRVAFGADGATVLTASDDGTAALWCLHSGARTHAFAPGGGWIADAALGAGVALLALSSGGVAAFDAATGAPLAASPGHAGAALCAALTARGRFGVTGGADGTARVWDLSAARCGHPPPARAPRHAGRVHCIAVAAPAGAGGDGARVVSVGDDGARAWTGGGAPLPRPAGGAGPARWARACPAASAIAVASPDGALRAWVGAGLDAAAGLPGHPGSRVRAFDAAPAASVAVFATYDSAVRAVQYGGTPTVVVLQSRGGGPGDAPGATRGHAGVTSVRLSADGTTCATAAADGTARVWETATGICRHVFAGHAPAVSIACTSFSVCGTVLLTIGTDGSALAWDAVHGGPPRPLTGPGGGAAGGRLAPDGARALLWSAPGAGGASVWLLATHGAPVRIAEAAQAPAGVSATAWSPCGRAASLGAPDGTLRVLRAADGAPTGFFMADAAVTAAAFVGAVAVAGCDDGAVHFLDVGGLDE